MAVLIASVLVAGCSSTTGGQPDRIQPIPPSPSASGPSSTTATPTRPTPTAAPDAGAPVDAVLTWIAAGAPADAAAYHEATRDGEITQLGADVAFTTPSGKTTCMTDGKRADGALACLVDLLDPPPRPADAYGEWKGGWVDYDGSSVAVGSVHGDPGRFAAGKGPELPYGQSLSFGDYRCRSDAAGLFCADSAHRSAVKFSDAGVEPFGCLQPVSAPPQIGEMFRC